MTKGKIVGYAGAACGPCVIVAAPDVGAGQRPAAAGGKPADQTRGPVRRRS